MQAGAGGVSERAYTADGFGFGAHGAGSGVGRHIRAAGHALRFFGYNRGVFGVQAHEGAKLCGLRQHGGELFVGEMQKGWHAGEGIGFEADYAGVPELVHVARPVWAAERIGGDAAPQGEITHGIRGDGGEFRFERGAGGDGRNTRIGHVEDGGNAAGNGGARGVGEVFAPRVARIIEMGMRVNHAGEEGEAAGVVAGPGGRAGVVPGGDAAIFNCEARRAGGVAAGGDADVVKNEAHCLCVMPVVS